MYSGFTEERLKEIIRREILRIDIVKDVGFADVTEYQIVQDGGTPFEYLSDAKTAIVYVAKMDEVINKFGRWYVASLNNFLKQTNEKVVTILKKHGLYCRGIIDERISSNLRGKISFRQLAVLAGLGSIGKNTCLLHPRYGPNVLIGVVLAKAYVPHDNPSDKEFCLNCDICQSKCPVKAIDNNFFDGWKCKNRRKILGKGCGTLCITNCPVSQPEFTKEKKSST